MKLKKTYSLFVCHLTLLAFLSILYFDISLTNQFSHHKTEVSSTKNVISNNLNFIFEEEQDNDDIQNSLLLFPFIFNRSLTEIIVCFKKLKKLLNTFIHYYTIEDKLFINYRVLRL